MCHLLSWLKLVHDEHCLLDVVFCFGKRTLFLRIVRKCAILYGGHIDVLCSLGFKGWCTFNQIDCSEGEEHVAMGVDMELR